MLLMFGFVAGALFAMYVRAVVEYIRAENEMNQAMTQMFNMVPESQRYGYSEDFPADQKWHL